MVQCSTFGCVLAAGVVVTAAAVVPAIEVEVGARLPDLRQDDMRERACMGLSCGLLTKVSTLKTAKIQQDQVHKGSYARVYVRTCALKG